MKYTYILIIAFYCVGCNDKIKESKNLESSTIELYSEIKKNCLNCDPNKINKIQSIFKNIKESQNKKELINLINDIDLNLNKKSIDQINMFINLNQNINNIWFLEQLILYNYYYENDFHEIKFNQLYPNINCECINENTKRDSIKCDISLLAYNVYSPYKIVIDDDTIVSNRIFTRLSFNTHETDSIVGYIYYKHRDETIKMRFYKTLK